MMRYIAFLVFLFLILPCIAAAPEGGSYEPDDSAANATAIPTDGTWQTHNFTRENDKDYVNFTAVKGRYYLIQTRNLSAPEITHTRLYIYDTDGTTPLSADDADTIGDYFSARIVWRATASGSYYVRITEINGTSGGTYNISVEQQGTLSPYLVTPQSWINVSKYGTFNFTAGVTCVGGPCPDVLAVLDPETDDTGDNLLPTNVDAELLSMLEEDDEVRVIVKLKDNPEEDYSKPGKAGIAGKEEKEQRMDLLKKQVRENQDSVLGKLKIRDMKNTGGGAQISDDVDFRLKHRYSTINAFSGYVTKKGLEKLLQDPDVEKVYPVRTASILLQQSVPLISADDVWSVQADGQNITGEGQTICILDTGINYNHADFGGAHGFPSSKVLGGYDYVNGDADPWDDQGHGSHVAGIAASEDSTYRGVAPGSKIVMIKVCDSGGSCDFDDIDAGIDWCVANAISFNISVISMSLGSSYDNNGFGCEDFSPSTTQAIQTAVASDIIVTVAAGNYFSSNPGVGLPACIKNATSVGGTNKDDTLVSGYQRGFTLNLLAPGYSITATDYTGTHTTKYGTSMSTPHVAGAAALLQQYFRLKHNRTLQPREIEWLLKFNGVSLYDAATDMTYARIDAYQAANAKGAVSTTTGATPFFTTDSNPGTASCLSGMESGESCNVTWIVNATGDVNLNYTFFAIFETDYMDNTTGRLNITIMDTDAPAIYLTSPADNANLSSNPVLFIFNASDVTSPLNCSLIFDNTTVNSSSVTPGQSSVMIYGVPSEGLHLWNITCSDGTNSNTSETRSLTYDSTAPNITLISPQDAAVLSANVSDFVFSALDIIFDPLVCDLYVNSTKKATNSSVSNDTNTIFSSVSLGSGIRSWHVNCTDSAGNTANSSSRTLKVPGENVTTEINTTANISYGINATANVDINISTGVNTTGRLSVAEYAINPVNVSAISANGFAALGITRFVSINASSEVEGNLSWYVLTIYYSDSDLPSNIDESTLRIYYFNETSQQWKQESDSGVNTTADHVWANITHFSIFSLGGSEVVTPVTPSGGGGGGGGAVASSQPIVVTPTLAASVVNAPRNQKIDVVYEGRSYQFKVTDIRASLLTVMSLPETDTFTIVNGLSKKLDIDDDGKVDIEMLFNGQYSGKALIIFYLVEKPAPIPLLPPAPRKPREPPEPVEEAATEEAAVEESAPPVPAGPQASMAEEPEPAPTESFSAFFAENRMFISFGAGFMVLAMILFSVVYVRGLKPGLPGEKKPKPEKEKKDSKGSSGRR